MWRTRVVVAGFLLAAACRDGALLEPSGQVRQAQTLSFGGPGTFGTMSDGALGSALAACPNGTLLVGAPGEDQAWAYRDAGAPFILRTPMSVRLGTSVACALDELRVAGAPAALVNQGGTYFAAGSPLAVVGTSGFGTSVAVGRNGHTFLLVGSPGGLLSGVYVYSLDDGGTEPELVHVPASPFATGMGSVVAAGDLNHDGRDELIAAGSDAGSLWVFWATQTGWASPPQQVALAGNVRVQALAVGELSTTHPGNELAVGQPDQNKVTLLALNDDGGLGDVGTVVNPSQGALFGASLAVGAFQPDAGPQLFVGAPGLDLVFRYDRPSATGSFAVRDQVSRPMMGATSDALFGGAVLLADLDDRPGKELVVGAPGWAVQSSPSGPMLGNAGAFFIYTYGADAGATTGSDGGAGRDGGAVDGGLAVDAGMPTCVVGTPGNACSLVLCNRSGMGTCLAGLCRPTFGDPTYCANTEQVCDVARNQCIDRPTADFVATPELGWAPLAVSFESSNPGLPAAAYAWSFGDAASSAANGPQTAFTYQTPGTYQASLEVTTPLFRSLPGTRTIVVREPPRITSMPTFPTSCDAPWVYQPTASGVVTGWKLQGTLPAGLTFDEASGQLVWKDQTPGLTAVNLTLVVVGDDRVDEQPIAFSLECQRQLQFQSCGCSAGSGPWLALALAALQWRRRRAR